MQRVGILIVTDKLSWRYCRREQCQGMNLVITELLDCSFVVKCDDSNILLHDYSKREKLTGQKCYFGCSWSNQY